MLSGDLGTGKPILRDYTYATIHFGDPSAVAGTPPKGLPCVGEYVAFSQGSPWYPVYAVVHCSFKSEFDAEKYMLALHKRSGGLTDPAAIGVE